MKTKQLLGILALTFVLPADGADSDATGQVYEWKDAQGVVHFSDQPPANPASPVEVQTLPEVPASPRGDGDYYSVENQAERLEQDRERREAARREAESQRLDAQRQAAETEEARARARQLDAASEAEPAGTSVYVYPGPPIRPPRPPHYDRDKPDHGPLVPPNPPAAFGNQPLPPRPPPIPPRPPR
jgi:hypothetical protein